MNHLRLCLRRFEPPTSLQGTAATNNACGDRLSLGSTTGYTWDVLHRMSSLTISGNTTNYEYRADGMRTHKKAGAVNTEYYYDAQMSPDPGSPGPMEDAVFSGGTYTVTRYGLGARGLDYMQQGTATTRPLTAYSTVVFPLYDAHGNMIATLARSGSSFTLGNQRSFDAWGAVRQGAATGAPIQRYCANLGHQQDDESGLIYMRARYYEPITGRFISEDRGYQGANWFSYCCNDPTDLVDNTGRGWLSPGTAFVGFMVGLIGAILGQLLADGHVELGLSDLLGGAIGAILGALSPLLQVANQIDADLGKLIGEEASILTSPEEQAAEDSIAGIAVDAQAAEDGMLIGEMLVDDLDE